MPANMTPEDRIRMMIGLDGKPVPAPSHQQWTPPIRPLPPVRLPPMYAAGMVYVGEGEPPPGSSPMTDPDNWVEGATFEPPSKRQRIADAHQKRKAMGY